MFQGLKDIRPGLKHIRPFVRKNCNKVKNMSLTRFASLFFSWKPREMGGALLGGDRGRRDILGAGA